MPYKLKYGSFRAFGRNNLFRVSVYPQVRPNRNLERYHVSVIYQLGPTATSSDNITMQSFIGLA